MDLIERDIFITKLDVVLKHVASGQGHCVIVTGEAGIGKTSLVRAFCQTQKLTDSIFQGTCDALFTPRPLAPLYDLAIQMQSALFADWEKISRTVLFGRVFHELSALNEPVILIFEDIHWADEATLDFIKFLARRIELSKCLFILTYRDNEIQAGHSLRNILGQLNPASFTRLQLPPLSREAVAAMAALRGYKGGDVYDISNGNPFYVTEILASYSPGIPDNIKDAILGVYHRFEDHTKRIMDILAVQPTGMRIEHLEKMEPGYAPAIEKYLESRILQLDQHTIFFKHELYRRTIEAALSPLKRLALNREILLFLRDDFERNGEVERIVHHGKNANAPDVVVKYAPLAAKAAELAGAHTEAAKLYRTAIAYCEQNDKDRLIILYVAYAYECYLTNQVKEAIIYQGKALEIYRERNDLLKAGDCMRFLSRLWWFDGNRMQAEIYGNQAVKVLRVQPSSREKAMAFSNMSQLKMLSNEPKAAIAWGEKAIAIAKEINDKEVECHALNNMGTVQVQIPALTQKGQELLRKSLAIGLELAYHEHAARAYTNLGSTALAIKEFAFAEQIMNEGIAYCTKLELGSWAEYMASQIARIYLETGRWQEAAGLAMRLLENENSSPVIKIGAQVVFATIQLRRGESGALPLLLDAKVKAFNAGELQRVVPVMTALLEYEWLTGIHVIEDDIIEAAIEMVIQKGTVFETNEFVYWLNKARQKSFEVSHMIEGYQTGNPRSAENAAVYWGKRGSPYMRAQALSEGSEENKREALTLMQSLQAAAVYEKLKMSMRASGIRSIPRGKRGSTLANAAFLTGRELDVLKLLRQGLNNKEIGGRLFISPKTVDHHISSILTKLNATSRTKAVNEALRMRILDQDGHA